jgi:glutathione peroxidase
MQMRRVIGWTCAVLAAAVVGSAGAADKNSEKGSPVLDRKMESLAGQETDLSKYEGKVVLIVNVASQCGATPQYEPLQKLYEKYKDQGLVVLGFPCNQFGSQEPGTAKEISEFCTQNYGVTFPMFAKIVVKGAGQHPLYQRLVAEAPAPVFMPGSRHETAFAEAGKPAGHWDPVWNFEKFLIDRSGRIAARFDPDVVPEDPRLVAAVETALAAT